jgi:hypothetical protein
MTPVEEKAMSGRQYLVSRILPEAVAVVLREVALLKKQPEKREEDKMQTQAVEVKNKDEEEFLV